MSLHARRVRKLTPHGRLPERRPILLGLPLQGEHGSARTAAPIRRQRRGNSGEAASAYRYTAQASDQSHA
eukprot:3991581-Pleurochrysis_carterae.AAC.2